MGEVDGENGCDQLHVGDNRWVRGIWWVSADGISAGNETAKGLTHPYCSA